MVYVIFSISYRLLLVVATIFVGRELRINGLKERVKELEESKN